MGLPPPKCGEMEAFYRVLGAMELSAEFGYTTERRAEVPSRRTAELPRVVVYPRHADKDLGPLASRFREANQPVSRTPNRFSTPRPRPLAGI
jgi:hypothetical protein